MAINHVSKHFMAFLGTLLIALKINVRIMCIWFCPLQIFSINKRLFLTLWKIQPRKEIKSCSENESVILIADSWRTLFSGFHFQMAFPVVEILNQGWLWNMHKVLSNGHFCRGPLNLKGKNISTCFFARIIHPPNLKLIILCQDWVKLVIWALPPPA